MKTNGTRRVVTFMLALVLVFTTVCVGTTEVEAAEVYYNCCTYTDRTGDSRDKK